MGLQDVSERLADRVGKTNLSVLEQDMGQYPEGELYAEEKKAWIQKNVGFYEPVKQHTHVIFLLGCTCRVLQPQAAVFDRNDPMALQSTRVESRQVQHEQFPACVCQILTT